MAQERKPVDWEAIEREYRAGQLSLREIGLLHGLTEGAIRKRAKAQEWPRNLQAKVREAIQDKLVRNAGTQDGTQSRLNERDAVEVQAERGAQVVREHRTMIGRGQKLVGRMLNELEEATDNVDEIEDAIEVETKDDTNTNRRNMMRKAVALPSRVSSLKTLADALKTFVGLERQAFGIDDGTEEPNETVVTKIERVIVDVANPDRSGVPAAAEAE